MNRSRRFLLPATATLAFLLLVTIQLTAQQSKFYSSQEAGGAPGRYRVALELRPGDDLAAVSRQIAATFGARIEPYGEEGFIGFAIIATPARARLMSSDPRVVAISDLSEEVKPAPPREDVVAARADTPAVAVEQTRRAVTTEAAPGFGDYTYDPSGNITSIGSQVFRYDAFGRVQSANLGDIGGTGTPATQVYTYDRYGNILKIVTNGDEANPARMGVDPATNQMDLPFSESNPANMIATYDTVGNVIVFQGSYEYDALNMMKETTDSARRLHVYSASDERVVVIQVQNNAETTSEWTLRDGSNRVLRRLMRAADGDWSWKEDYIYGGSRLLAAELPAGVRHFHLDHLGTPRLITGDGGVTIAEKTYDPFGRKVSPLTDDLEQLEFTGHERDLPSLDYMHARYYRPDLGRFVSVDPGRDWDMHQPQSWNMYSYARNNPVLNTDPDGKACLPCIGIGAAIGGTLGIIVGGARETYAVVAKGRPVNNHNILAAGAAGFVSGGLAGACGACGFAKSVAVGTIAGTAGGAAARIVDGNPSTQAYDPNNTRQTVIDATGGAVGGAFGFAVAKTTVGPAVEGAKLTVSAEQEVARQEGQGLGAAGVKQAQQAVRKLQSQELATGVAVGEVGAYVYQQVPPTEDKKDRP